MMVGAFLYLPGRYQGASVIKVLLAACAAVNGYLWLGNNVECRDGQPVAGGAEWQATKRGAWLPSDMICCWFDSIRPNRVWLNHPGYTLVAKETASTYRNHIYVGYHDSAAEKRQLVAMKQACLTGMFRIDVSLSGSEL